MVGQPQNKLMTVTDVIMAMGISRSTWQKLVSEGKTPPIIRIGAVQRIKQESFDAWIGQRQDTAVNNS